MKSCENCRHLSGNECDLFGDYVPSPFDTGEGCKLKHNEVAKLIRLADNVRFDNGTKEDMKKYDDYFTHLKHKYEIGMDEKKQIEEMAAIMAVCDTTCDECFEHYEAEMTLPIANRADHCQAYLFAQRAFEAGYRKIPSDAVVLTKEEYIELTLAKQSIFKMLDERDTKSRKETKKEIFGTIIKSLEERKEIVKAFYGIDESVGADIAIRTIKELAKRYGVEVEE